MSNTTLAVRRRRTGTISRRTLPLLAALSLALVGTCQAAAQAPASSPTPLQGWAAMADRDVNFALQWFKDTSILAVYPDPAAFAAVMAKARAQADRDLAQVSSFEGYRQTMLHFFSTFNDAHAYVSIKLAATGYQWPGFQAVYRGGRFVVAGSDGSVADGAQITACDGSPMTAWSARLAPYENVIPGVQSTYARIAPLLFRDGASPFLQRPKQCTIDGRSVDLQWKPIPYTDWMRIRTAVKPPLGKDVTIAPFGADGAWVRLGNFSPDNRRQSDQFYALYAAAPSLRDKAVIVFDVRGNGGGPYEWFMGVLRSLYGNDYANYYARERLKIFEAYRILDDQASTPSHEPDDADAPAEPPIDGIAFDADDRLFNAAKARGEQVLHAPVNHQRVPKPKRPPANPVRARVIVLTDYDCASACVAFVDELKQFPGVQQVGTETFVDSRTGSPISAPLPSGNGVIGVPYMTRDGRPRGDNQPQIPSLVFDGDIADTAAVQAWLRSHVLAPAATR